ncbi:MAG: transposase, partial [Desulfobacterales bacterium]
MGVKPNYGEVSWLIFQEDFQSEDDCYAWLLKTRWPEGFICPKCGSKDYWSI